MGHDGGRRLISASFQPPLSQEQVPGRSLSLQFVSHPKNYVDIGRFFASWFTVQCQSRIISVYRSGFHAEDWSSCLVSDLHHNLSPTLIKLKKNVVIEHRPQFCRIIQRWRSRLAQDLSAFRFLWPLLFWFVLQVSLVSSPTKTLWRPHDWWNIGERLAAKESHFCFRRWWRPNKELKGVVIWLNERYSHVSVSAGCVNTELFAKMFPYQLKRC